MTADVQAELDAALGPEVESALTRFFAAVPLGGGPRAVMTTSGERPDGWLDDVEPSLMTEASLEYDHTETKSQVERLVADIEAFKALARDPARLKKLSQNDK
jgi:hypothetical protein